MVRVSNALITILNTITLVLSVLTIAYSIWLYVHPNSLCQKVIQRPLLIVGLSLFVLSLIGLFGSCLRYSFLLWIYLAIMFFMIVGLLCFSIFTLVITNKGVGQAVSGKGFKEYRLGDYSAWLQKYVVNEDNWDEIKSCLHAIHYCTQLENVKAKDFNNISLSPMESGCCKPPSDCGFQFQNATYWIMPKTGPGVGDPDCKTWNNNQTELCFDCNSCKAGVLANIKKEWRTLAIINFCIVILVGSIYSVGCCALRNNRGDRYNRRKNYP